MASKEDFEVGGVEERLNSFLTQLHSEYAILDRIVYKNKNQHRRGSYFQYLMKVRSDLRLLLLQSVKLEEILVQCFYVIDGKKPKQKVSALESLKKTMRDSGKYNFMERLLGAARLLSQSVEPMLKAASKISTMLAQSFFVGFSVTVLAIIARLRVLVQQILLDVVLVFNTVSSISHQRQSIKIIQQGVDVFREYYPKHGEKITLECVWETDKFVLIERKQETEIKAQDMTTITSTVKYASIEAFLGDNEPVTKMLDTDDVMSMITNDPFDAPSSNHKWNRIDDNESLGEYKIKPSVQSPDTESANIPKPTTDSKSSKRKIDSVSRRVAFVSVKKPTLSTDGKKETLLQKANSSSEDPFSNVISSAIPRNSLF